MSKITHSSTGEEIDVETLDELAARKEKERNIPDPFKLSEDGKIIFNLFIIFKSGERLNGSIKANIKQLNSYHKAIKHVMQHGEQGFMTVESVTGKEFSYIKLGDISTISITNRKGVLPVSEIMDIKEDFNLEDIIEGWKQGMLEDPDSDA